MQERFKTPVTLLVGMGHRVEVRTVMDAYVLLNDWPLSQRNATHAQALNACKAALIGEVDVETARANFVAFARRNDLLVQPVDARPDGVEPRPWSPPAMTPAILAAR